MTEDGGQVTEGRGQYGKEGRSLGFKFREGSASKSFRTLTTLYPRGMPIRLIQGAASLFRLGYRNGIVCPMNSRSTAYRRM